jgi:hypothetical protein
MASREESPIVILTHALPPAVLGAMLVQVAVIVGGLMIGALALGLFIDARFGSRPLFTLLFALTSLPISAWLTYRLAMRTSARARKAYEAYLESKRSPNGSKQLAESMSSDSF